MPNENSGNAACNRTSSARIQGVGEIAIGQARAPAAFLSSRTATAWCSTELVAHFLESSPKGRPEPPEIGRTPPRSPPIGSS
jgi:hypothetical protein